MSQTDRHRACNHYMQLLEHRYGRDAAGLPTMYPWHRCDYQFLAQLHNLACVKIVINDSSIRASSGHHHLLPRAALSAVAATTERRRPDQDSTDCK